MVELCAVMHCMHMVNAHGQPMTKGGGCDQGIAARFMELWTLKEAYVKALGRGIAAPPGLRGFSVTVEGSGVPADVPSDASTVLGSGGLAPLPSGGVRVLACSEGAAKAMGLGSVGPRVSLEQHADDVVSASHVQMVLLQPDGQHVGALCCVDAPHTPLRSVRMWHVEPW